MQTFINPDRPSAYCPGCTHEKITTAVDKALAASGLEPDRIAIVTDIGCSGLFDTRFDVHALHGVHGRALTYAAGLKLADPGLTVIVTMGDGGLGIGGAHLLAACRRNLDLTLIVLNNFNFGMTGGQYSVTTPSDAITGSGFLNQAEIPLDVCAIAQSAGATYVDRCSGFDTELTARLTDAIAHNGFSLVETLGLCTGRYTGRNRITPKTLSEMARTLPETLPDSSGWPLKGRERPEYGEQYRKLAQRAPAFPELGVYDAVCEPVTRERQEIIILGSAGMRIVTAGNILCLAGLLAGMHVSMKNDYNITVLKGQSVSEVLMSPEKIGYTGIEAPGIVVALSDEGVARRKHIFKTLSRNAFVLKAETVSLPDTPADVIEIDFKSMGIRRQDWALASLAILASHDRAIDPAMLNLAIEAQFDQTRLPGVRETLEKVTS